MKFTVVSLNVGRIQPLNAGKRSVESAYGKKAVSSAVLTKTGFESDSQADLKNHGGTDKAVCVFSSHHFEEYSSFLAKKMPTPSFGENLTVDEADEQNLFIGDVFACGEIKLQISQPRQPCAKTGMFHNNNGVIKFMMQTGKTGFYFRVLSGGTVCEGDEFIRVESDGLISLTAANDIMYRRDKDIVSLKELIGHPFLSAAWKGELSERLVKT